MRVAVVHNAVTDASAPDELDVLVQTDSVRDALGHLGHEVFTVPCSLDLDRVKDRLEQIRPGVVFNLVESIDGQWRLAHLFPALLDTMALPYTGSTTLTLLVTTHKIMAKERLAISGLRTPAWLGPYPPEPLSLAPVESLRRGPAETDLWIVKSVWEHASFGMEEDALLTNVDEAEIETIIKERAPRLGGSCFAEAYIDGREFNLAVLAGPNGPQILPPAEIIFDGYDDHKPRIVGYQAKWAEDSYEYHHTPRRFDFPLEDDGLLARLEADAVECWRIFGIGGFARADFPAALTQAGLSYPDAVERILQDGLRTHEKIGW
jgi:D-alanine-D-alanine ligase